MANISIYDRFTPMLVPQTQTFEESLVFVPNSSDLLTITDRERIIFPSLKDFDIDITKHKRTEYLGMLDNRHCFCLSCGDDLCIPEGMAFKNLREILGFIDEHLSLVAQRSRPAP